MADPFFKRISERRQPLGKLFTAGAFFGFVYIISCYTEITLCPVSVFLTGNVWGAGFQERLLKYCTEIFMRQKSFMFCLFFCFRAFLFTMLVA